MKPAVAALLPSKGADTQLRLAIRALCERFGVVRDLDLIRSVDGSYLCYVELTVADQRFAMMRELGGAIYGSGVRFRIPPRAA